MVRLIGYLFWSLNQIWTRIRNSKTIWPLRIYVRTLFTWNYSNGSRGSQRASSCDRGDSLDEMCKRLDLLSPSDSRGDDDVWISPARSFGFYLRRYDERSRDYQSCYSCDCCCCCNIFPTFSFFGRFLKQKFIAYRVQQNVPLNIFEIAIANVPDRRRT